MACGERAKICRDPQFLQATGELGGFRRRLRLAGVVLEDGMAIAVQRQGDAPALDQALHQDKVASGVLTGAKHGVGHRAGGVVHRQQQDEFGSPVLQPGVMAAVQLHQHPGLGHPLAAETVLRRAPAVGSADARLAQNAPHRGPAEVDALPLAQELGDVGMVGALIALGGQRQPARAVWRCGDGGRGCRGRARGALLAIGRRHPAGVAWAHSQQFGGLGDGHLVFQNRVEHG